MEGLRSALKDLDDYVVSEGPFDAIMGFSEGASLAATYIVQRTQHDLTMREPVFRCAVFICAGNAWDSRGEGSELNASLVGEAIQIPTAHIVGSKDEHFHASIGLSKLCDSQTREVFNHEGGHEVPRGAKVTRGMAMCINSVIEKADLMQ